jgi:hypothetical protein
LRCIGSVHTDIYFSVQQGFVCPSRSFSTQNNNPEPVYAIDMPRLLSFDELPAWMKKDPRIRRGYREELRNVWNCFLSLFYVHNEFVNIWSHLLPAIVYGTILAKEARFALVVGSSDTEPEKKMVRFYVVTSFALMSLSVSFVREKAPMIQYH